MFFNESEHLDNQSEVMNPKHHAIDYSKGLNHTFPLLVLLPIYIFMRKIINTM